VSPFLLVNWFSGVNIDMNQTKRDTLYSGWETEEQEKNAVDKIEKIRKEIPKAVENETRSDIERTLKHNAEVDSLARETEKKRGFVNNLLSRDKGEETNYDYLRTHSTMQDVSNSLDKIPGGDITRSAPVIVRSELAKRLNEVIRDFFDCEDRISINKERGIVFGRVKLDEHGNANLFTKWNDIGTGTKIHRVKELVQKDYASTDERQYEERTKFYTLRNNDELRMVGLIRMMIEFGDDKNGNFRRFYFNGGDFWREITNALVAPMATNSNIILSAWSDVLANRGGITNLTPMNNINDCAKKYVLAFWISNIYNITRKAWNLSTETGADFVSTIFGGIRKKGSEKTYGITHSLSNMANEIKLNPEKYKAIAKQNPRYAFEYVIKAIAEDICIELAAHYDKNCRVPLFDEYMQENARSYFKIVGRKMQIQWVLV